MSDMIFPLLDLITNRLEELKGGINHLRDLIEQDPELVIHDLAIIPYRKSGQDSLPETVHPEPVSTVDRTPELLSDLVTSIFYREDQHPKSTIRASGLIGASQSVLDGIKEVNRLKAAFKDAVKQVPPRRRRMLNKHFPGLSRLQAYRELVVLDTHPDGAHFFWAANKTGGSRKTVADLRKELEIERESVPATDTQLLQAIEYDLEKLAGLQDNEVLSKRRQIRLHPQCNIWVNGQMAAQEDAYLPIFYLLDPVRATPEVTPLPSSSEQGSRVRGVRSDRKVEEEPFLERIYAYRYLPEHREFKKEK